MTKETIVARVEEIERELISQGLSVKYSKPGIYCIKIEDQIVYIGKSRNMLRRVAEHLVELERWKPSSNKYKVIKEARAAGYNINFDVLYKTRKRKPDTIQEDIGYQEGVYIRKYMPALNYQIPKEEDWHFWTANKAAKTITLQEILDERG